MGCFSSTFIGPSILFFCYEEKIVRVFKEIKFIN